MFGQQLGQPVGGQPVAGVGCGAQDLLGLVQVTLLDEQPCQPPGGQPIAGVGPGPAAAGFTISGALDGVAAASGDSAWAAGCTGCFTGSGAHASVFGSTLILRWNGTAWTRILSPDPGTSHYIADVAAGSAGSAWAVGCTGCDTGTSVSGRTLILRWNGTAWTQVPSPSPGTGNYLSGVAVTPAGAAWAVGDTDSAAYVLRTLILRWNGTAWTTVPSPNPGTVGNQLFGVAVTPDGTAWAVGYSDSGGVLSALILRWNGTAWTTVPSPSPADSSLVGVAAAPDGTAWAVGYTQLGTSTRALILHAGIERGRHREHRPGMPQHDGPGHGRRRHARLSRSLTGRHLNVLRLAWHGRCRASRATLKVSGSSRAPVAGAGVSPGGTGAGRWVNLASCQIPGPRCGQTAGGGRASVVLWFGRDAGRETRVMAHLARPRCGGVPLAEGFPRHATGPAYPLIAVPASAHGSAGPARPACRR